MKPRRNMRLVENPVETSPYWDTAVILIVLVLLLITCGSIYGIQQALTRVAPYHVDVERLYRS